MITHMLCVIAERISEVGLWTHHYWILALGSSDSPSKSSFPSLFESASPNISSISSSVTASPVMWRMSPNSSRSTKPSEFLQRQEQYCWQKVQGYFHPFLSHKSNKILKMKENSKKIKQQNPKGGELKRKNFLCCFFHSTLFNSFLFSQL